MELETTFMHSHYKSTCKGSINFRSKGYLFTLNIICFYAFDSTKEGDLVCISRTCVLYHPSQNNPRCICLFIILFSKCTIRKSNKFIHLRSDIRKKHIISSETISIEETIHSSIEYLFTLLNEHVNREAIRLIISSLSSLFLVLSE